MIKTLLGSISHRLKVIFVVLNASFKRQGLAIMKWTLGGGLGGCTAVLCKSALVIQWGSNERTSDSWENLNRGLLEVRYSDHSLFRCPVRITYWERVSEGKIDALP